MKYIILLTALLFAACSSTQFTIYKTSEDEPAWSVSVEKRVLGKFVCSINDSVVVEDSYLSFGSYFEKDGHYGGKNIKMIGSRTSHSNWDQEGNSHTSYTYYIRILIDEQEVGYFVF